MTKSNSSSGPTVKTTIQSLERGLSILETLSISTEPLSALDICNQIGIHRTTLYALLNTLIDRGYIEKEPYSSRYRMTGKLYEMSFMYPENRPITRISKPYVNSLGKKYDVMARVSYVTSDNRIVITYSTAFTLEQLQINWASIPLYASSTGKLMCAHMSDEMLDSTLANLKLIRFTPNTITDVRDLRSELEDIKVKGYALDKCEYLDNTACCSFPIYDKSGCLCGILSMTGEFMYMEDKMEAILREGLQYSKQISMDLGWDPSKA